MRKAINFDINTKEYEKITGKKASNAYDPIKRFLLKRNFIHRQGSGYISKYSLSDVNIFTIIQSMSTELDWLRKCVEQIDVTNIGKQHSLIDAIETAPYKKKDENLNL